MAAAEIKTSTATAVSSDLGAPYSHSGAPGPRPFSRRNRTGAGRRPENGALEEAREERPQLDYKIPRHQQGPKRVPHLRALPTGSSTGGQSMRRPVPWCYRRVRNERAGRHGNGGSRSGELDRRAVPQ